MAAIPVMTLTQKGKEMYSAIHSGSGTMKITSIKVGSGYIADGETADNITSLKNEESVTVDIISIKSVSDGTVCITARITSAKTDFYLREIAVFAKTAENSDVLYGYCNYGENADYVNTYNGSFPVTQEINIYIAVGSTKNITIDLSNTTVVTPYDLQGIKHDISRLDDTKISYQTVSSLPYVPIKYDFEDSESRFSIPKQGTAERGTAEILTYSAGGKYQAIKSEGSKSSSGNVYSSMTFDEIADCENLDIEFDYKMDTNGRWRIAVCDTAIVDAVGNADIRYNETGIALDIFSCNSNSQLKINDTTYTKTTFFAEWVHVLLNVDYENKNVKYVMTVKDNENDKIEGTAEFKDAGLKKITGIAVYTWLAEEIDFEDIVVTAKPGAVENVRYVVKNGDTVSEYAYIGGVPICIGGSDITAVPELNKVKHSHSNKSVLDEITADDVSMWTYAYGEIQNQKKYSTTPVQVGTWIDGRKIYRVAISHTLTDKEKNDKKVFVSDLTPIKSNNYDVQIINECVFMQYSTSTGNLADAKRMTYFSGYYDLTDYDDMINNGGCDGIVGYIEYAE